MKQRSPRRQSRYGRTVAAPRWRTTPERLARMKRFVDARGIDKTELIELALDEYMNRHEGRPHTAMD